MRCGVKRKLKDDSKGLAWERQGTIANDGMGVHVGHAQCRGLNGNSGEQSRAWDRGLGGSMQLKTSESTSSENHEVEGSHQGCLKR